ncbi:MAG TPA: NADH-quinone oxidoreductase subunit NuoE [Nitrospiria bacterium]|nr:NADH-quinone oxidoreductase subunit NuoE [Nitrospiria bacterium]
MTDITKNGESTRAGLSEAARVELQETAKRYPVKRSAVLHGLRLVQREAGFVTEAGMRDVAALLEMTPHEVYDVATFYTLFYLRPKGEYLIQVCRTLPCALGGAETLLDHLERRLGIRAGETTPDGKFTLVTVECLAACGKAPVMQVNDRYHEAVTPEQVDRLIESLNMGARPAEISDSSRLTDSAARTDADPSSSQHAPSDAPTPRATVANPSAGEGRRRDGHTNG